MCIVSEQKCPCRPPHPARTKRPGPYACPPEDRPVPRSRARSNAPRATGPGPRARAVFPWARRAIRPPRGSGAPGSGTARDRTRKLSLPRPQAPRPLQAPCPGHARGESGGPGPSSGFRQSEARYKCAQPVLAIVRRAGGRGGGGGHVHLPGRALGMGAGGDVGDRRRLGLV